jgi:hypothetical protein
MEGRPQLDDEAIARIQVYPHCCKILERFMQEIVTPLFSQPLDPQNPRNDQGALDYISSWKEQVTRSKDPKTYFELKLKPRNPIDAFVKWIHAGFDPAAFPYHMQALYAAVGYVPDETQ